VAAAITREQIVDVAESIARRDGLDAVTVRRVSAELGVTPAAMYWHLEDKQELVSALVDRASARTERPGADYGTWLERLVRFYVSTREEFTAIAGLGRALVTTEPTDATLANCLFAFELLTSAGFGERRALGVFDALSTMSWGHLMMIDVERSNQGQGRGDAIAKYSERMKAVIERTPGYAVFARDFDDDRSRAQLVRGLELIVRAAALEDGIDVPPLTRVDVTN